MPTHYAGDERVRLALDAYIKLRRAGKVMSYLTSQLLNEHGLTESQLGTLEALYYLGPMAQNEIGDKLLVTGGNMTMVINNLEKRGLARRERDEDDGRRRTISLTDEGHRLIDGLFPVHAENIASLMNILCPEELEELGRLCKILGTQNRNGHGKELE